ncbi:flagellar hook-length control protein FliK [Hydrogenophaga sp.]|uniref:flagellar hook-length control protein FliK n=1 Tax=Hydrogenophaga sp. TaxID=1904254 RepID=UPI003F6FB471
MSANAVSRPAEPQRPAQASPPGKAAGDKPVESDLFASLLGLVSDTHPAPDASAAALDDTPAETPAPDGQEQNPLAALLAWAAPAAAASAAGAASDKATANPPAVSTTTTAAAADPGWPARGRPEDVGVDISGMTPVAQDAGVPAEVLPTPANPATTAARPAFATAASRPAFASRADASQPSAVPAMVWQRGAVSGTDALQQQFASQSAQHTQGLPAMHVRSTVAMDERFTPAASGAWQASTPADAGIEWTLPGTGGLRATPSDAGPSIGGAALSDGASLGDSTGGSTGDALPGDQGGQAHDGTPAEREADGPTVSHWGTQHLRHASLRVGESGADAIDIQLSMKGQEVQVAFQSDNAEARASLREGASDALAELLQRSGIQLGHVSVGSQGQQGGGSSPHTPTVSRGDLVGRAETPPPAPATPTPRADGSQPLDLFV